MRPPASRSVLGPLLTSLSLEEATSEDPVRYRTWHLERIRRTASLVERFAPPGCPVLDVGASPLSLDFARLVRGHPLTILDPGATWDGAWSTEGVRFVRGSLLQNDLAVAEGSYGAVVAAEVFEHLPECPMHLVPRIRRWLGPGGIFVVTTPNQARFLNRIRLALGVNTQERPETLFHKEWMGYGHIREYTIDEFEPEFAVDGLEVVEIGSWSPHAMPRFDWVRRGLDRWGPRSLGQVLYGVFRRIG